MLSFSVVRCSRLDVSGKLSMNCSGEPMLGTECTFACPERWTLNGSVVLTCGATGHWSGMLPTCEGEALSDGGCLGRENQREESEQRKEAIWLQ